MFSKTKLLLCTFALFGLVACGNNAGGDDEFEQNTGSFQAPVPTMYIVGSHWANWDPAAAAADPELAFTMKAGSSSVMEYDVTLTSEMLAGYVGFKFVAGGSWDVQYGMEDIDFDSCNEAFRNLFPGREKNSWKEGTNNRSNVQGYDDNSLAAGVYHIEYDSLNVKTDMDSLGYKFVINFTAAE